tara:strand:+ start:542 stop:703 length:162 start_codon:yes stop_codon:yes gene_type:complete
VKIHRKEVEKENVLELPLPMLVPAPEQPNKDVKEESDCIIDMNKCDLDNFIVD